MNFIKAKSGKISIGDALLIAGVKVLEERLSSPFIGNGTLLSGGIKLGSAMVTKSFLPEKVGDIVSTALTVDGAEDIVTAFFGGTAVSSLTGSLSAVNLI